MHVRHVIFLNIIVNIAFYRNIPMIYYKCKRVGGIFRYLIPTCSILFPSISFTMKSKSALSFHLDNGRYLGTNLGSRKFKFKVSSFGLLSCAPCILLGLKNLVSVFASSSVAFATAATNKDAHKKYIGKCIFLEFT